MFFIRLNSREGEGLKTIQTVCKGEKTRFMFSTCKILIQRENSYWKGNEWRIVKYINTVDFHHWKQQHSCAPREGFMSSTHSEVLLVDNTPTRTPWPCFCPHDMQHAWIIITLMPALDYTPCWLNHGICLYSMTLRMAFMWVLVKW